MLRSSSFGIWALLASFAVGASENITLPDFGRSANAGISEREENAYGLSVLRQLRNAGALIEDPQLAEYLRTLGTRLGEASDQPEQRFTMVLLRDSSFNAFAVPGGVIAVHSGLVLAALRESELAAVLAHETAHVTQKHIVRAMERSQKASIPIMLGTIAAIAASSQAGSSSGNLGEAAMVSGMALMQQLQINFTRDNEFEADRIGIQTLQRAGFEVSAMAAMFMRMQSNFRTVGLGGAPPQYLQSHPISTTRIAEAKARAQALIALPARNCATPDTAASCDSEVRFSLMRERVRVLEGGNSAELVKFYRDGLADRGDSLALQYGLALSLSRAGKQQQAGDLTDRLLNLHSAADLQLTLQLLRAEIAVEAREQAVWQPLYAKLLSSHPRHRVVGSSYAAALLSLGSKASGTEALGILRDLTLTFVNDPSLYEQLGRAYQLAGDEIRAGESYAQATALRGALEDALLQLETLARRPQLDYYGRARLDALIAEITPIVLEIREAKGESARTNARPTAGASLRTEQHRHGE